MNNQPATDANAVLAQQVVKQVINAWTAQNKIITNFFNKYNDEAYLNEVAPGRNSAVYLLGHLTSTADGMLPLLGIGERQFPHLEALFSLNPDKFFNNIPNLTELKQNWENVNTTLITYFKEMSAQDWLDRHTKVSVEDFAADPLRNKLNVLISRTNHISYHSGQLTFLTQQELAD
jgi:hypothetical protein